MRLLLVAALLLCAGFVSADDKKPEPKATVTGTLTLNGKPLDECMVAFHPVEAGKGLLPFATKTDKDGKFKVEVPAGEYSVACLKIVTDEVTRKVVTVTPSKYADPKTSGIRAAVKGDKATFDIALASK